MPALAAHCAGSHVDLAGAVLSTLVEPNFREPGALPLFRPHPGGGRSHRRGQRREGGASSLSSCQEMLSKWRAAIPDPSAQNHETTRLFVIPIGSLLGRACPLSTPCRTPPAHMEVCDRRRAATSATPVTSAMSCSARAFVTPEKNRARSGREACADRGSRLRRSWLRWRCGCTLSRRAA